MPYKYSVSEASKCAYGPMLKAKDPLSESAKPARIHTYLHERPRKTKTNMHTQALFCKLRTETTYPNSHPLVEDIRRGCSQSEFQVTNFFSCSEGCGEVHGDKFKAYFSWEILTEYSRPEIHHIFHFQTFKISSP